MTSLPQSTEKKLGLVVARVSGVGCVGGVVGG